MKKLLILAVCFATLAAQAQLQMNFGKESPLQKLQIAEMAIKNLYVDTVNENKLAEDAIKGMLEKLDPHSSYSSAKETKATLPKTHCSLYNPLSMDPLRRWASWLATAS